MPTRECLSEDDVAELLEGRLPPDDLTSAEIHLDECPACRKLVGAVSAETQGSSREVDDSQVLLRNSHVGRYVVLDVVGSGAMGRVYAAYDPELDRKVALKLLHAKVADPQLEARLRREAKAMARASHTEVITVYDAGLHGSQLFIAMEFLDGGTLRAWQREKPRPWREVLAVYLRAGRGLAQAHAAGLVHRDFKPDNVLIGTDGRVRVTDFGLARAANVDDEPEGQRTAASAASEVVDATLTRPGTLVGTPAYMAPEQLRGSPADERSDVYAFCVSLYEGLYGEHPFEGRTLSALEVEKSAERVQPPPAGAKVPLRLRRALLAGLRARPEDRYASMEALLAALEGAKTRPRAPVYLAIALLGAGVAAVAWTGRGASRTNPTLPASSESLAAPACDLRACSSAHGGEPWVCRASDRTCVPVASEDCTATYDKADLEASDTVWIGAMFPTKGEQGMSFGQMNAEGVELARVELAHATRALDGSNASRRVRRIALVTCNDAEDAARAARHLVDDLNVPAILGFGSGQELVDLAGSLLIRRRVLSVASLTSSPLITRVPQPEDLPRMVWRTTFSIEEVSEATSRFLHDLLEPRVAAPGGRVRVTVARVDASAGLWFGDALYRDLVFNGRPAVENGEEYKEIPVPAAGDLGPIADRVAAGKPSFVVLLNQAEVTSRLVAAIEVRWPAGTPRPVYLVANDSAATLASFAGSSADRRHRVFALTSVSDGTENARFVMRFNESHARKVSLTFNPGPSYDAFYLLAYATYALGDAGVDGPALARAIRRLVPPGRPVEVGPNGVFDAINTLLAGESVDLRGVLSPLDFDLARGEETVDFELLCPAVDRSGRATGDAESGVYYRAAKRATEGTIACP